MVVNLVHVHVKPEFVTQFVEASRLNHEGSIKEPGIRRFDVVQDAQDPCKFVFYEVFVSPEAIEAHRATSHYQSWRDTVAPWMAKPREGIRHTLLFPAAL